MAGKLNSILSQKSGGNLSAASGMQANLKDEVRKLKDRLEKAGADEDQLNWLNPADLRTEFPFNELFLIRSDLQNSIAEDMQKRGFDCTQPLHLWKNAPERDGRTGPILIDGHTRRAAAMQIGLAEVPVFYHLFDSEQDAVDYAIHLQKDRRNLTDADLFRYVLAVDLRVTGFKGAEQKSYSTLDKTQDLAQIETPEATGPVGRTSAITAEKLGTSPRKVEKIRTILDHGPEVLVSSVREGEKTINRAYEEIQALRTQRKNFRPSNMCRVFEDLFIRDTLSREQAAILLELAGRLKRLGQLESDELGFLHNLNPVKDRYGDMLTNFAPDLETNNPSWVKN
jgi:hypothetical protein